MLRERLHTLAPLTAVAAASALTLSACGSDSSSGGSSSSGDSKVKVVASFYPLQYALEQIGGDKVEVTNLTKPGQEPHDLDLAPQQVLSVEKAQATFYVKGFQSSVDKAVDSAAKGGTAHDVSSAADLSLKFSDSSSIGEDDHDHAEDHDHEHNASDADPHFWLDPVRYKAVVEDMGAQLEKVDPKNKSLYAENTKKLATKLDQLNSDYSSGLKQCANKNLVTGHAAFGYLAKRYGLTQVGVAGVSPDAEPTPGRLKDVADFVKKHNVKTIYSETLVSPKTAETVASQTGAKVEVLDPIEGITDASKGKNYLDVMSTNLATLKQGQSCK